MSRRKGHDPFLIYEIIRNRVIEKVIPRLGKMSNAQRNFSIAMMLIALFAMVGFGIYADGEILHPPAHYTGVCPAPATIHGSSCTLSQIGTVNEGSTTKTTTVQIPAGTIQTQTVTTVTVTSK